MGAADIVNGVTITVSAGTLDLLKRITLAEINNLGARVSQAESLDMPILANGLRSSQQMAARAHHELCTGMPDLGGYFDFT